MSTLGKETFLKDKEKKASKTASKTASKKAKSIAPQLVNENQKIDQIKNCIIFLISQAGLTAAVFFYCVFGGFLFMIIENREPVAKDALELACIRHRHTQRLWNITISMANLQRRNWSSSAMNIFMDFQKDINKLVKDKEWDGSDKVVEKGYVWSYAGAFLYSVTVITTIGFGNLTPKSDAGRMITLLYAVVGIPMMLVCLANIGKVFAKILRFVWLHVSCQAQKTTMDEVRVPITLCMLIVTAYLIQGATLFSLWEGWPYSDSFYFCFITLSTIGFGDLVPGYDHTDGSLNDQFKRVLCALYVLFGMALVAMCFELMQMECSNKLEYVATYCKCISKPEEPETANTETETARSSF